jgi:hypothetical protein
VKVRREFVCALDGQLERAIPGVGEPLKPTIDALKANLVTL